MALSDTLAAVKWPALACLGALVVALILVQQQHGYVAILFAVAAGWALHRAFEAWPARPQSQL